MITIKWQPFLEAEGRPELGGFGGAEPPPNKGGATAATATEEFSSLARPQSIVPRDKISRKGNPSLQLASRWIWNICSLLLPQPN